MSDSTKQIYKLKEADCYIKQIPRTKNANDLKFIISIFKSHFIFSNMDDNELKCIAKKVLYYEADESAVIFEEKNKAEEFFILEKGSVEVKNDGKTIKKIQPGEGFGDLALLYNVPRTSTAVAMQHTNLWVLKKEHFRAAVEEATINEFTRNLKYLEQKFCWENLFTSNQMDALASSVNGLI